MNGRGGFTRAPPQNDEPQWANFSRSRNTASSMLAAAREAPSQTNGRDRNPSNVGNRAPDTRGARRSDRAVLDEAASVASTRSKTRQFGGFVKNAPRNTRPQNVAPIVPSFRQQNITPSVFDAVDVRGRPAAATRPTQQTNVGSSSPSTSGHSAPRKEFSKQFPNEHPSSSSQQPLSGFPHGYFPEGYTGEHVVAVNTFDPHTDPISNKFVSYNRNDQGYRFDDVPPRFPRQPVRSTSARDAYASSPPTVPSSAPPSVNTFSMDHDPISGRSLNPFNRGLWPELFSTVSNCGNWKTGGFEFNPVAYEAYLQSLMPLLEETYSADQERMNRYDFVESALRGKVIRGVGRGGPRDNRRGRGARDGGQHRRRGEGHNQNHNRQPHFMKKEGTAPGEEGGMWASLRETAEKEKREAELAASKSASDSKMPLPLRKSDKKRQKPIPPSTFKIAKLLRAYLSGIALEGIVDRAVLENVVLFVHNCCVANVLFDEDSLSVSEDSLCYPPSLKLRDGQQMRRPIIIDGCAIASAADENFMSVWEGITRTIAFHKKRILPMKPLIQAALDFVLNGHKVIVTLPEFYMEPRISNSLCKVDDLEAFNILLGLGIIQFVEPTVEPVADLHAVIKEVCRKVHGCFFSHQNLPYLYQKRRATDGDDEDGLLVENEIDHQKILLAEGNSDERVMSISFCGPQRKPVVSMLYAIYAGVAEGENKYKDQYYQIGPETIFLYTEKDGDEHDYAKRMEQQLRFCDQIKQILVLSQLCDLPIRTTHAVQMFLLVAEKFGIHLPEIMEFVDSCPIVEEPGPLRVAPVVDDLISQLADGCTIEAHEEPQEVAVEPLINFEVEPSDIQVTHLADLPLLQPTSAPAPPPPEDPQISLDDLLPPMDPPDISIHLA